MKTSRKRPRPEPADDSDEGPRFTPVQKKGPCLGKAHSFRHLRILAGDETAWQSRGKFAKKRVHAMKKYLERMLEKQPDRNLELLVIRVTSIALQSRCDWRWFVQIGWHSHKLHVISHKHSEAAEDLKAALIVHVLQKAEEIVAKALEDVQEVVLEGPPDRAMAMSSL